MTAVAADPQKSVRQDSAVEQASQLSPHEGQIGTGTQGVGALENTQTE